MNEPYYRARPRPRAPPRVRVPRRSVRPRHPRAARAGARARRARARDSGAGADCSRGTSSTPGTACSRPTRRPRCWTLARRPHPDAEAIERLDAARRPGAGGGRHRRHRPSAQLPADARTRSTRPWSRLARALRPGGSLATDLVRPRVGRRPRRRARARRGSATTGRSSRAFSVPAPDQLRARHDDVRAQPDGSWRRDDEHHDNVMVDTARVPALLAAEGVDGRGASLVRRREELPVGVCGPSWAAAARERRARRHPGGARPRRRSRRARLRRPGHRLLRVHRRRAPGPGRVLRIGLSPLPVSRTRIAARIWPQCVRQAERSIDERTEAMPGQAPFHTDEHDLLLGYLAQQRACSASPRSGSPTSRPAHGRGGAQPVERRWADQARRLRPSRAGSTWSGASASGRRRWRTTTSEGFTMGADETLADLFAFVRRGRRRRPRRWCGRSPISASRCRCPRACRGTPTTSTRWSVRWVLMHLVTETARHAGHADIVREARRRRAPRSRSWPRPRAGRRRRGSQPWEPA